MNEDTDNKYGVPQNHYEQEIRELNRKVYSLYQKVEKLLEENHELKQKLTVNSS